MVFAEQMLEMKLKLEELGHTVFISDFTQKYTGLSTNEKEELTRWHKNEKDAIRLFWEKIKNSDAILVLNFDRRGVKNYIGGNTLLEIGFAHVLEKKVFLLNEIPAIPFYESEIVAMRPVILNGDLTRIA